MTATVLPVRIHEFADGTKVEFRATVEPGFMWVESRYIQSDGFPFVTDGGKWYRVDGETWAWFQDIAPDIYAEFRAATQPKGK